MIIHPHIPKRKPRKPTAAQRQLASDWEALVKKYEPKKPVASKSTYAPPRPYVRDTGPRIPSLSSGDTGVAAAKPRMQYTGTKMIGIGTLHKSNAVPVFSEDEAADMARMRRG
jgi:hypothetical protein